MGRCVGRAPNASSRLLLGAALLVGAGGLVTPAAPAAEIPRTTWQRLLEPMPDPAPVPAPPSPGDPAWYAAAAVPEADDPAWVDTGSQLIDASGPSLVTGCNTAVHYTYFQTFVTVVAGVGVDTFALTFAHVDDGVRASVFHERDPGAGEVVPASYVRGGEPGPRTVELAHALRPGVNRVVLTHEDNCAPGTALRLAAVALSGGGVPLAVEPAPDATAERATEVDVAVAWARSAAPPGDLRARISWGDGSPATDGAVVAGGQPARFTVRGRHTYAAAGTYRVTTTVRDAAEPPNVGTASMTVTVTTRDGEVQVDCTPGAGACTAEPPPGRAVRFGVQASGGTAPAKLLARLDGGPAPECAGYAERSGHWVEFGFTDAAAGATWATTVSVTRGAPVGHLRGLTELSRTQVCFAAPYAFAARAGFLRTGGPGGAPGGGADFVGVLPDCWSATKVPGPCVSSRALVPVAGGWSPRLEFRVPPGLPGARGRT